MDAIKEKPILFNGEMVRALLEGRKTRTSRPMKPQPPDGACLPVHIPGTNLWEFAIPPYPDATFTVKSPYQVGDHLWVKETWCRTGAGVTLYRATADTQQPYYAALKWKSARFMFKKYARIWREVVGVRGEMVREISEEDAKAEGCYGTDRPDLNLLPLYSAVFKKLWQSLYPGSWERNEWLFVYDLKPLPRPGEDEVINEA